MAAARPLARCASWVLGLLVALAGVLGAQPLAAHAQTAAAPLRVTITSLAPSSPSVKDTVVLTGTVRNTSSRPVSRVQVHMWRSTDAIADSAALDEVLASSADNPLGRRMVDAQAGNVFNVTTVDGQKSQAFDTAKESLEPGEEASFTVKAAMTGTNSLGLASQGVYLVGVQVRGVPQGDVNQTVGRARTLLTVPGSSARQTSTAVLLSSRPSMVDERVLRDDHLEMELTGRLATLLALAKQPDTAVLVDPSLMDDLTTMSRGYRVQGSDDTKARAAGRRAATDFLAALAPLLEQPRTFRTLYGSPDVRALVAHGQGAAVTASEQLPTDHPLVGCPLAVLPADGVVDEETLAALKPGRPSVVLASNLAGSGSTQTAAGLRLVRWASGATRGGPGPGPSATQAQVLGRLQAEQWLASSPELVVVDDQAGAQALQAAASWRSSVPLTQVLTWQASTASLLAATHPADPDQLASAQDLVDVVHARAELEGQGTTSRMRTGHFLAQTVSTRWRSSAQATAWLSGVRGETTSLFGGSQVQLRMVDSFVTSSSQQEIPVTVTNRLDRPVTLRVVVDSESAQRISVADSPLLTVAAGDSETLKLKVTGHANGTVGMTASMQTADGRRVGAPHPLTITATQAGRVGWLIIIASGVVFMAGTALRIRQVQRERRGVAGGAADAKDLPSRGIQ